MLYCAHSRQKLARHAKRVTIKPTDHDLLRDIVRTLDPQNPLGRKSKHTNTEHYNYCLQLRRKQAAYMKKFEQKRAAKLNEGLYPKWNRDGVLRGWSQSPMDDPIMETPWWEEHMPESVRLQDPKTVWGSMGR